MSAPTASYQPNTADQSLLTKAQQLYEYLHARGYLDVHLMRQRRQWLILAFSYHPTSNNLTSDAQILEGIRTSPARFDLSWTEIGQLISSGDPHETSLNIDLTQAPVAPIPVAS